MTATAALPLCGQENQTKEIPEQATLKLSPLQKGELRKSGLPDGKESVRIPLKPSIIGYLAEVTINEKKLLLLVDTGASVSFISNESAKKIGLQSINTNGELLTINSSTIKAKMAITQKISIGEAWVKNEPLLVVNIPQALTAPLSSGLSCDGILGMATLADWDVCFHPAENHLTLYPIGKAPALKGEFVLPLFFELGNPEVSTKNPQRWKSTELRTSVRIGEHIITATPDTGSGGGLLITELMAQKLAPKAMAKAHPPLAGGISASGLTITSTVKLPSFHIGPDKLHNLPTDVIQLTPGSRLEGTANIGMNLLRHYIMTFRFADKKLHLKPLGTVQELTQASTAGLSFHPDFTIMSCILGGPADKAGLKAGDRVLEIHGIQFKTITPAQFRAFKQLAPGTPVKFRYKRGDAEPTEVNVVLIKQ